MHKLTNEEFLKILKERRGDEYTPLDEYKDTKTKIRVQHTCGHIYEVTPNHLLNGRCCPRCSNTRRNVGMGTEWFKNQVAELTKEYEVLGEYHGVKTKIKMKHLKCGTEFEMRPEDFRKGQRCPACARKRAANTKIGKSDIKFNEKFKELSAGEYELIGEFTGFKNKVKIKHLKCGHEFEMLPRNFLKGNRCPKCFGLPLKTQKEFEDEVYSLVGNEYTVIGGYSGYRHKVKIRHNTCGYEYDVAPGSFLINGNRCPHCCFKSSSKSEKEVVEYIRSIYKGKVTENYRSYNDSNKSHFKEIDAYLPDLKIGIEYCGLYWHSEERGKDKKYHIEKMVYFYKKGIQLVQIFEDEWLYKRSIVEDKLRNLLGINTRRILPTKKCKIEQITAKESNNFLCKYDINGPDSSKIHIGLKYNDILLAVMTFKHQKSKYILSRYADNNIEGFGKLFSYAVKKHNMKYIDVYADARWVSSDSSIYTKNGFVYTELTRPKMWYIPNGKHIREENSKYTQSKLKELYPSIYSDTKTKIEIMHEAKYKIIWDCGMLHFIWKAI